MIVTQADAPAAGFRPFFNPATGEWITYTALAEDTHGQLVRFTWRSVPGGAITEHIHPRQEERFTILAGQAHFTLNGQDHVAGPGETVIIPAGVPHSEGNPGPAEIDGIVELRPALHAKEWHEALAGLVADGKTTPRGAPRNPLQLGATFWHFRHESRVTSPPIWAQNLMLPPLWALATAFGIRPYYRRWDSRIPDTDSGHHNYSATDYRGTGRSRLPGRMIVPGCVPQGWAAIGSGTGRGYSPVAPSIDSRRRSAWPLWRAYSSIMWHKIQRRLGERPSGQVRLASWPSPSPRSSASATSARERSTARCHKAKSSPGESPAAVCHSQSGSAVQSTASHGGAYSRPRRERENQPSSTRAMCLRMPPRVIVEAAVVARRPAASSPEHFQAKVAR
jgi:quercetin dioxygenase-like cupin family protein